VTSHSLRPKLQEGTKASCVTWYCPICKNTVRLEAGCGAVSTCTGSTVRCCPSGSQISRHFSCDQNDVESLLSCLTRPGMCHVRAEVAGLTMCADTVTKSCENGTCDTSYGPAGNISQRKQSKLVHLEDDHVSEAAWQAVYISRRHYTLSLQTLHATLPDHGIDCAHVAAAIEPS